MWKAFKHFIVGLVVTVTVTGTLYKTFDLFGKIIQQSNHPLLSGFSNMEPGFPALAGLSVCIFVMVSIICLVWLFVTVLSIGEGVCEKFKKKELSKC